jgi:hypothetical protein
MARRVIGHEAAGRRGVGATTPAELDDAIAATARQRLQDGR